MKVFGAIVLAVFFGSLTLPSYAQTTTPHRKKPAPAKTATPAVVAPKKDDDGEDMNKDLPDIGEDEFKNPHLYHSGTSSILAVVGISFPNQAEAAPRPIYGAEYFYRFRHNLTFGASALYSAEHSTSATGEFKFNCIFIGVAPLYDAPEQFVPGMHIGPAFYLVHVDYRSSDTVAKTDVRKSALTIAIGPKIGFKFPISGRLGSQIETAILYSPPIKDVGSFLTVNFSTGIRWDF